LYTGTMLFAGNNSLLDARSFSLTGQNTPQPAYNKLQSSLTFGGPFQIPSVFRNGMFLVGYARTQNRNAVLQTAQMPTAAERLLLPGDQISPQAKALLDLYPLPNFDGPGRYNYQIAVLGVAHADNLQAALNNFAINQNKDRISLGATRQSTRSDAPNLFGFTDSADNSATTATITWSHRFTQRITGVTRY